MHARSSYKADEVVWNARFENIWKLSATGNPSAIDISRIDELVRTS